MFFHAALAALGEDGLMKQMGQFLFSRAGATAVEYAMVAALVSAAVITGAASVGNALSAKFDAVGQKVAAVAPN